MTSSDMVAHRRRRLLELNHELGNIADAWFQLGFSRIHLCEWRRMVARHVLTV